MSGSIPDALRTSGTLIRGPQGDMDGIAHYIWKTRYRHDAERTFAESLQRVAHTLSAAECDQPALWEARFLAVMREGRFLPAGRILAGAGTGRRVTLANCFVMGVVEDTTDGIFRALQEGAITLQQGGGVGYDFSTLRPRGSTAPGTGIAAPGPVAFMQLWNSMCQTMLSTGTRRGAMMATLRCDHPDIEAFIDAKRDPETLQYFNLSVQVSDAFMTAIRNGSEWPLVFPGEGGETLPRIWTGHEAPVRCHVHRRVDARALWDRLLRAAYDSAEPGVLFIDRINHLNNLAYCERITATNPCGEAPLPPYGACVLGSVNLAAFIINPFTQDAHFDEAALAKTAQIATRMLDNAIDFSGFPLPAQQAQALASRRIGLGIMGLADALIMLGLRYDEAQARQTAASAMRTLCHAAYRASVELAREKGPFPRFRREAYLASPFIKALPASIRDAIARQGIRNSHLTAIAPTGTISLAAGGISGGMEPVLAATVRRSILQSDQLKRDFDITDHAIERWKQAGHTGLPPAFIRVADIPPEDQLAMQSALQPFVDGAISKTVTIPRGYSFAAFQAVYESAYDKGLKGCTAFRPTGARGKNAPLKIAACQTRKRMTECSG